MNRTSVKVILMLHFISLALWLGGVVSGLPLLYKTDVTQYDSVYPAYLHLRDIAWNVIGWGGIGGLATGLILSLVTPWGLFKHRWVVLKLILVIALVLFGMFFNEHRMLSNIDLLEHLKADALHDTRFISNHYTLKVGLLVSVSGFVLLIAVAVFKPWMKKSAVLRRQL